MVWCRQCVCVCACVCVRYKLTGICTNFIYTSLYQKSVQDVYLCTSKNGDLLYIFLSGCSDSQVFQHSDFDPVVMGYIQDRTAWMNIYV